MCTHGMDFLLSQRDLEGEGGEFLYFWGVNLRIGAGCTIGV